MRNAVVSAATYWRKQAGLCLAAVFLLAGCTNQQIYTAIQENRRQECGKLPLGQYEQCMRDYDTSYEEYERQRQAAIDSGSAP
jgi:hypothetical protein